VLFNNGSHQNAISDLNFQARFALNETGIQIASLDLSTYRGVMGQQHRVRTKRRRRRAYLQRKKAALHAIRREPAKPRAKKQLVAAE
jgi:hypothetical protein